MFAGLVARSGAMLHIFRLIENLEESEATVLITGESGTGKELVARALHLHSPRRNGPFVAVNCGTVLDAHHWRRDEAAKTLGMSRTTLWRKMRELDLIE